MTPELWQRVEAALDAIEAAPSDERSARLDQLRTEDPTAYPEVARMLAVADDAEGFLDEPVWGNQSTPPPSRFGPYRIESSIGRGGMGEVFLARRDDGEFDQQVAIKRLDARPEHQALVRRFRDERQILAGLEHPNIARLIGGGTAEDGRPYLVMEHVEGEAIDTWCDRHALGVEARIRLLLKVCSAVQAAHQRLIVHRDLKPSNILVDTTGEPKLLDFGIATVVANPEIDGSEADGGDAKTDAEADHRAMTPAYASPEQIRGEAVTTASDIHALGILLYELLTGHHPYAGDDPSTVTDRIEQAPPTPPSHAGGPDAARRLAGDLDAIITKALSKDPADRYDSAAALGADLRRHLEHRPVLARRPTLGYRLGCFVRRNRVGSALATLLVLVILGATATAIHLWRQAVAEQERAEEVAEFLEDLYQLPDPRRDEGATVTALELLRRSASALERDLADQPADRASLLLAIGSAYRGLGQHDRAADFLSRGLDLQREVGAGMNRRRLAGLLDLAAIERGRQQPEAAAPPFIAALGALDAGGLDHPRLARQLNNHASLLEWEGDFRTAETLYRHALAMKRRLLGDRHEDVATAWNNLATTLLQLGVLDEAETMFRQALDVRLELFGADSAKTLATANNLAVVLRDRGDLAEAETMLRDNLDRRRRLLGDAHPALGTVINNLAMARQWAGDATAAEALYAEVGELFETTYGPDHVNVGVVRRNRATLALDQGDPARAEGEIRAALATFRDSLGAAHWRVADAESVLGACLAALGRPVEAEALLRRSVMALEATKGARSREAREARDRLASQTTLGGLTDDPNGE